MQQLPVEDQGRFCDRRLVVSGAAADGGGEGGEGLGEGLIGGDSKQLVVEKAGRSDRLRGLAALLSLAQARDGLPAAVEMDRSGPGVP